MTYGLTDKDLEKINEIFLLYPTIERAIIYGSRVKGNYKPGSDIDLALVGNGIDLNLLNNVSRKLDDLLLPYTFDLSIFSHIKNSELIDHINHAGKQLYKSEAGVLHD